MGRTYNLNIFYANKDLARDAIKSLYYAKTLMLEQIENDLEDGNYYVDTKLEKLREINWLIIRMESSMKQIDEFYDKKDKESEEQ